MQTFSPLNSSVKSDRPAHFLLFFLVAILLLTFFLRMVNLDADPAPWYTEELGYQVDEGYKTLSPRNLFLYGDTHWNAADKYGGWMRTSAMTQWPYYLSFKTFGEDLSSARIVSIIYALGLLIITAFFLWNRLSPTFAALGILLLTVDPGLFLFSRSALFETSLVFFTYATLFLSVSLAQRSRLLPLITIIIITTLAFFFLKRTFMLYVIPIVISFGFVSIKDKLSPASLKRAAIMALILLALVCIPLYFSRGSASTSINLAQFMSYPHAIFLNPVHTLSPLALIMAYAVIVELLLRQPNAILNDWYRLSLTAMVILVPIMLSFFTYNAARYHLPVLPAAILLIIERLSMTMPREQTNFSAWFSVNRILAVVAFLLLSMTILASINYYIISNLPLNIGDAPGLSKPGLLKVFPFFFIIFTLAAVFIAKRYWFQISDKLYAGLAIFHIILGVCIISIALAFPSYQAQQIRHKLIQHMKQDESVGGDWAPFFVANTKLRGLYMRPNGNNAENLTQLRPDFFLHSNTPYDKKNLNNFKFLNNVKLSAPVILGNYAKHEISLYSIEYFKSVKAMESGLKQP